MIANVLFGSGFAGLGFSSRETAASQGRWFDSKTGPKGLQKLIADTRQLIACSRQKLPLQPCQNGSEFRFRHAPKDAQFRLEHRLPRFSRNSLDGDASPTHLTGTLRRGMSYR
jgi:hypothetical protein